MKFKTKNMERKESVERQIKLIEQILTNEYLALQSNTDVRDFETAQVRINGYENKLDRLYKSIQKTRVSIDPSVVVALITTVGGTVGSYFTMKSMMEFERDGHFISPNLKNIPSKLLK